MLVSYKGVVRGNTVLVDDEILPYDGCSVVVTILEKTEKNNKLSADEIDWDSFVVGPSERSKDIDAYMREMDDDGRI